MVTILLIIVNIIVFSLYGFSDNETKYDMFMLFGLNYSNLNNYITYFSSMFLHLNVFHIGMNMFALYDIGRNLEKRIGSIRFLLVYIITGLFGSVLSAIYINFNANVPLMVVGASGAIFGIWAYEAFLTKEYKVFFISFAIFHIVVFAADLPIAWYAHLGGAIMGFLIGFILKEKG